MGSTFVLLGLTCSFSVRSISEAHRKSADIVQVLSFGIKVERLAAIVAVLYQRR